MKNYGTYTILHPEMHDHKAFFAHAFLCHKSIKEVLNPNFRPFSFKLNEK